MLNNPLVTVAIRSYMRLDCLIELIEACRKQDYPNFEILVIEQSETAREAFRSKLEELKRDPRVRILEYPKLGNVRAMNEAIRQSRGAIILSMDDDDLPATDGWIGSHARNFADPLCVAVIGREILTMDEDPTPHNTARSYRRCLTYSPLLKLPRSYTHHTRRIVGVEIIKGGNTSIRRSVIERVGLWEESFNHISHEEQFFDFKFAKVRRPGEHYVYEPEAVMLRRLDKSGGMERRLAKVEQILFEELFYSHTIIRRFFPLRFYTFYPLYLLVSLNRTLGFIREHQPTVPTEKVLWESLVHFLPTLIRAWR